jgi:hypothetical protein
MLDKMMAWSEAERLLDWFHQSRGLLQLVWAPAFKEWQVLDGAPGVLGTNVVGHGGTPKEALRCAFTTPYPAGQVKA